MSSGTQWLKTERVSQRQIRRLSHSRKVNFVFLDPGQIICIFTAIHHFYNYSPSAPVTLQIPWLFEKAKSVKSIGQHFRQAFEGWTVEPQNLNLDPVRLVQLLINLWSLILNIHYKLVIIAAPHNVDNLTDSERNIHKHEYKMPLLI